MLIKLIAKIFGYLLIFLYTTPFRSQNPNSVDLSSNPAKVCNFIKQTQSLKLASHFVINTHKKIFFKMNKWFVCRWCKNLLMIWSDLNASNSSKPSKSLLVSVWPIANKSLTIYVMRKSTNQNKLLIEYLASIKTNHKWCMINHVTLSERNLKKRQ